VLNKTHEAWIGALSFSVTPILNYVHRGIGDYTVHHADHCREIQKLGSEILGKCNQRDRKCNTSSYEEYLVIASAWLHDLGNIYGREKHNETVCDILDKLGPKYIWGLIPNSIDFLKWICYSHPPNVPIEKVPEFFDVEGGVKLRFLAALFRLLDASDIANRRAPLPVYELLKDHFEDPETDRHWVSHQAIMDVSYPDNDESIIITAFDEKKAQFAVDNFGKNFESVKPVLIKYEFPWRDYRLKVIEKVPIKGEKGEI